MPAAYELEYRDGGKEDHYGHRGYYYVFDRHTLLSFLPIPAWCHQCARICLAEDFSHTSELEREVESMKDPAEVWARNSRSLLGPHSFGCIRTDFENTLAHRRGRTASPRCLKCGQPGVSYFTLNQWTPHPGTGIDVLFTCVGMCSTNFAMRFFEAEGQEIAVTAELRKHYGALINARQYF